MTDMTVLAVGVAAFGVLLFLASAAVYIIEQVEMLMSPMPGGGILGDFVCGGGGAALLLFGIMLLRSMGKEDGIL